MNIKKREREKDGSECGKMREQSERGGGTEAEV